MLSVNGIPSERDLESVWPSITRLKQGPVALIECFQNIPCNPCATSCSTGAIAAFEDINDKPKFNPALCNGCGNCIAKCPGLAISVVDYNYTRTKALLKIPYEFVPLPIVGNWVQGLDRSGTVIGTVQILKVQNPIQYDKTPVLWLSISKNHWQSIKHIGQVVDHE